MKYGMLHTNGPAGADLMILHDHAAGAVSAIHTASITMNLAVPGVQASSGR